MRKASRIDTHKIETKASDIVRSIVDATDVALFRELSGRDYGVDAILELFCEGRITGKIAYLQIKGKQQKIIPLMRTKEVSCTISASNAEYADQFNIPVIVIYASLADRDSFYYVELQDALTDEHRNKLDNGQEQITIRIPCKNQITDSIDPIRDIIDKYYDVEQEEARMVI